MAQQGGYGGQQGGFGGGPPRPQTHKIVDSSGTTVRHLKDRIFNPEARLSAAPVLCAAGASGLDMLPPAACRGNASSSITTRFVHSSFTKDRCSINAVAWTPEGRRLLAGTNNGMLTLWSGVNFAFEATQQAHEVAIRSMEWSHTGEWLISADHEGIIKYWAPTLNNVKEIPDAHPGYPAREVSFAPTDAKFVSCSDDATVKVWDFERGELDVLLKGNDTDGQPKSHGWDVKTAQWHPDKSLIASGSKDNVIKLWDPRAGKEICILHLHKNTVTCLRWHPKGQFFASGSRDQLVKLFDLRAMREAAVFKGHKRELSSIAWHPSNDELLATGAQDGALLYWSALRPGAPLGQSVGARGQAAHEAAIWTMAWHPLGHQLCSGANDNLVKFWSRHRPGDGRKREREEGDETFDDEVEMRMLSLATMAANQGQI